MGFQTIQAPLTMEPVRFQVHLPWGQPREVISKRIRMDPHISHLDVMDIPPAWVGGTFFLQPPPPPPPCTKGKGGVLMGRLAKSDCPASACPSWGCGSPPPLPLSPRRARRAAAGPGGGGGGDPLTSLLSAGIESKSQGGPSPGFPLN